MTPIETITFQSTRFGQIECASEDVIQFADGLFGFPEETAFVLICHKPDSNFRWLQSLNDPALAFLIVPPQLYVPTYVASVKDEIAADLGLSVESPALVYCVVSIPPGNPEAMTINLAGPLIINAQSRRAVQAVVEDEAYTIRHPVFQMADRMGESAVA